MLGQEKSIILLAPTKQTILTHSNSEFTITLGCNQVRFCSQKQSDMSNLPDNTLAIQLTDKDKATVIFKDKQNTCNTTSIDLKNYPEILQYFKESSQLPMDITDPKVLAIITSLCDYNFDNKKITNTHLIQILDSIQQNPKITKIKFNNIEFVKNNLIEILKFLQKNTTIKQIIFPENQKTDLHITNSIERLANLNRLHEFLKNRVENKTLKLEKFCLFDECIAVITPLLSKYHVENLDLSGSKLFFDNHFKNLTEIKKKEVIKNLANLLASTNFVTVDLSSNELTEHDLVQLISYIEKNSIKITIENLDLNNNNIKDSLNVKGLQLSFFKNLKTLSFNKNNLQHYWGNFLGRLISENYLVILNLQDNCFLNKGMADIALALPKTQSLKGVYLSNTGITNQEVPILLCGFFNNSSITNFVISSNKITSNLLEDPNNEKIFKEIFSKEKPSLIKFSIAENRFTVENKQQFWQTYGIKFHPAVFSIDVSKKDQKFTLQLITTQEYIKLQKLIKNLSQRLKLIQSLIQNVKLVQNLKSISIEEYTVTELQELKLQELSSRLMSIQKFTDFQKSNLMCTQEFYTLQKSKLSVLEKLISTHEFSTLQALKLVSTKEFIIFLESSLPELEKLMFTQEFTIHQILEKYKRVYFFTIESNLYYNEQQILLNDCEKFQKDLSELMQKNTSVELNHQKIEDLILLNNYDAIIKNSESKKETQKLHSLTSKSNLDVLKKIKKIHQKSTSSFFDTIKENNDSRKNIEKLNFDVLIAIEKEKIITQAILPPEKNQEKTELKQTQLSKPRRSSLHLDFYSPQTESTQPARTSLPEDDSFTTGCSK